MMDHESVTFDVKLAEKDVMNFMYYSLLKRKSTLIIYILYFIAFLYCLIDYIFLGNSDDFIIFIGGICLAFLILYPLIYYLRGKSAYKNNARLKEQHHYVIDPQNIHITGESFDSVFTWDKTFGVSENKYSFFIWQQKNIANIIPKRDIEQKDIDFLRKMRTIYKGK